jgi:hypothetical protein
VDLFNLKIEIKELPLKMPPERNSWLILVLEREGYFENKLIRLNRVRCHQQVLFYLDIFDTRERSINRRYLTKQTSEESWSRLIFPRKNPAARHFPMWKEALGSIPPTGVPQYRLGNRINPGHYPKLEASKDYLKLRVVLLL